MIFDHAQPSPIRSCRRFKPQPHRTVIVFAIDLHRREANTISDLQTNPVAIASFRPTHQSCRCQTHPSISLLSDPLASFRPTHQSVVLYLSLSLNLSLPLPLSRSMLIFEEDCIFFWLIWFIYSDFLL